MRIVSPSPFYEGIDRRHITTRIRVGERITTYKGNRRGKGRLMEPGTRASWTECTGQK